MDERNFTTAKLWILNEFDNYSIIDIKFIL
jgi:hypothetical protein